MPLRFPYPIPIPKLCQVQRWSDRPVAASGLGDFALAMASDGSGGFFALTVEGGFTHWALRLCHVSAAGVVSSNTDVNRNTALGTWYEGTLVAGAAGSCLVVWTQSGAPLVAERFDTSCTRMWAAPAQLSAAANSLRSPVAAPDGSDGAIVAFYASATTLALQRVSTAGALPWAAPSTIAGAFTTGLRSQIVTDANGASTVLWQTPAAGLMQITAQRTSPAGQAAGAQFGVQTVADTWAGLARVTRAVSDGAGGFYTAFAVPPQAGAANARLTAAHVAAGAVTPSWQKTFNLLANPNAFSLAEDGAGGLLLASVSTANLVSAHKLDSAGTDLWATGIAGNLKTINLQLPAGAWANRWAYLTSIVARGAGGAILIYQDWPSPSAGQLLFACCLNADGTHSGLNMRVSSKSGIQDEQLLVRSDGETANVVWTGDSGVTTGFDVFGAKIGCCPPAAPGIYREPPSLFCEIPMDLPVVTVGGFGVRLPCGNRAEGFFGIVPFHRLAGIPGVDAPGSFLSSSVRAPDWIRIWFFQMQRNYDVLLVDHTGETLATAEAVRHRPEGLEAMIGHTRVLTFTGKQAAKGLLAFTLHGDVDQHMVDPIRVEVQYGLGREPPAPTGKPSGPDPR